MTVELHSTLNFDNYSDEYIGADADMICEGDESCECINCWNAQMEEWEEGNGVYDEILVIEQTNPDDDTDAPMHHESECEASLRRFAMAMEVSEGFATV
jgi:hypothetical protein